MWETLTWWRHIRDPNVATIVRELEEDSLRFLVRVMVAGYLAWHLISLVRNTTHENSADRIIHLWALFVPVMGGLAVTDALQRHGSGLARQWFLLSSLISITAAVWLLAAPDAAMLYPLLALAAVVLFHPLAGLGIGAAAVGALVLLRHAGPLAFLSADQPIKVGIGVLLTVTAAGLLEREMITAVDWWSKSHASAIQNAAKARENRAELARALNQLDRAYYQLQRANAALELAWKAADTAERSKSEFVTNISHELRTPLNLIIGFSEMILLTPESYRTPLPPAYRGDLNAIYRSAQHLLTLSNDVIDLARVGMGRLALAREPVDLAQIISDACAVIQPYIESKGLWLRQTVPPTLPVLHLDRLRIRQVMLNLLTNAARFTERGGITVSVTQDERGVVVTVIDTGRGIPPEELPNVLKEFHSTSEDRARAHHDFGGVGLGLPLSKRFIELHGGRLRVTSTVGVGSSFWFSLPIVTTKGIVQHERRQLERSSGRAQTDEQILILAGYGRELAEFLERHLHGYRIIAAADLQSAAVAAVEVRALAILADLDLVIDQDGPVPVLRLALPHGERIATALGAAAYLTKPITPTQLYCALDEVERPIRTVLIVEDDARFLRLVSRMLETRPDQSGYEILSASDGHEALELMDSTRPDVVLLDLALSEMGGEEMLTAMRARSALADIPAIIISAQDQMRMQLPLPGSLAIRKRDGFQLDEILGAIEALLVVLRPPQEFTAARHEAGSPLSETPSIR